jgi:hypothetical protein
MDRFTGHSVLGYTQQEKDDAVLQMGDPRLHTNGANRVIVTICQHYFFAWKHKSFQRTHFPSCGLEAPRRRNQPKHNAVLANVLEIPRQGRVCAHQSQYTLQRPDFSFNCHVTDTLLETCTETDIQTPFIKRQTSDTILNGDFALRFVFSLRSSFNHLLGGLAKLQKKRLASSCLSVRMEKLGTHWMGFHEIWYSSICRKYEYAEKIEVSLKSYKHNGYFT